MTSTQLHSTDSSFKRLTTGHISRMSPTQGRMFSLQSVWMIRLFAGLNWPRKRIGYTGNLANVLSSHLTSSSKVPRTVFCQTTLSTSFFATISSSATLEASILSTCRISFVERTTNSKPTNLIVCTPSGYASDFISAFLCIAPCRSWNASSDRRWTLAPSLAIEEACFLCSSWTQWPRQPNLEICRCLKAKTASSLRKCTAATSSARLLWFCQRCSTMLPASRSKSSCCSSRCRTKRWPKI